MKNIFAKDLENYYSFEWNKLGNIKEGRQSLGEEMPVLVYRLFEYSMKHVLYEEFGPEKTNELFRRSGYIAGKEYALNALPLDATPGEFVSAFTKAMEELKIGIVRIEHADFEKGDFVITVYEDLDCSGLPPTNEVVCNYDEGFLSGVLETYLKHPVTVREVDCWASGERVCRFKGTKTDAQK